MFDRLGRKDNETPFVLKWFVEQGISVWSTVEGEQRFDSNVDDLLNYIRFWQASSESQKTSVRIKTRMKQIVEDGHYMGGTVPFGYRAVYKGRMNKKGRPVKDLEIDPREGEIVREIFFKVAREGYSAHGIVPFPVSWTVKMKKKQKETQDILSYHSQAAGCSDKARAKASGGRQPIEECGRTGL